MPRVWFSSDFHYGHKNIIPFCERPFSDVDEMAQVLIDNWNAVVAEDDIGWILGDLAIESGWQVGLEAARQMKGRLRLVEGNHDRVWSGKRDRWKYVKEYNSVFEGTTQFARAKIGSTKVNLSHFPYTGDSGAEERFNQYRLPFSTTPLVHGHTHVKRQRSLAWGDDVPEGQRQDRAPQLHVGVDAWDYKPVSAETLERVLNPE